MLISEARDILKAEVFCGENFLSRELHSAFASDYMSDVLAFVTDQDLLITCRVNPQVIRTAQMMDIKYIVFVRNLQPTDDIIEMAKMNDMVIMSSPENLFDCCGLLYKAGLKG